MEAVKEIDFAVIGVQKSATSTLQSYLKHHRSVFLPDGEQACFETPDYEKGRPKEQLAQLGLSDKMLKGIKRPNILHKPLALYRLKNYSPRCKLIVVLRDPVERFVSAYFHVMTNSKIPVMDINKAIREMFFGNYLDRFPVSQDIFTYGLYHPFLQTLYKCYEPEGLLVLSHDEMKKNAQSEMNRVTGFLGVEDIEVKPNSGKKVGYYSYGLARLNKLANVLRYSYSPGRLRLEPRKSRVLRKAGRVVEKAGKTVIKSQVDPSRVLSNESIALLMSYYEDDRKALLDSPFSESVYW